ncbi:MAG: glutaredoxin 3 [Myxococcota bacterium]|nr:glutaredoxin 3 [Deltaproteobacteria bacterium]MDQ3339772.1 glutaredoxin 3 [Myxococcota bacterium]
MTAHVKMYTRKWCGYCTAAENLLDAKGVEYEQIDCTGDHATRAWLLKETGRSTVPQIFIDGKPVGGYDDLRALDRRGVLDRMLAGTEAQPAT